jgi:hypothetical protein
LNAPTGFLVPFPLSSQQGTDRYGSNGGIIVMPPASLRTLRADETGKGNISLRCELLGSGREQFCNYLYFYFVTFHKVMIILVFLAMKIYFFSIDNSLQIRRINYNHMIFNALHQA